jgi:hypothetical protein
MGTVSHLAPGRDTKFRRTGGNSFGDVWEEVQAQLTEVSARRRGRGNIATASLQSARPYSSRRGAVFSTSPAGCRCARSAAPPWDWEKKAKPPGRVSDLKHIPENCAHFSDKNMRGNKQLDQPDPQRRGQAVEDRRQRDQPQRLDQNRRSVKLAERIGPKGVVVHMLPSTSASPREAGRRDYKVGKFRSRPWTTALAFRPKPWTCANASPTKAEETPLSADVSRHERGSDAPGQCSNQKISPPVPSRPIGELGRGRQVKKKGELAEIGCAEFAQPIGHFCLGHPPRLAVIASSIFSVGEVNSRSNGSGPSVQWQSLRM